MQVHGRNGNGVISATIDGVRMDVPDNMANAHRRMIWDQWEMAPAPEGTPDSARVRANTIPDIEDDA